MRPATTIALGFASGIIAGKLLTTLPTVGDWLFGLNDYLTQAFSPLDDSGVDFDEEGFE